MKHSFSRRRLTVLWTALLSIGLATVFYQPATSQTGGGGLKLPFQGHSNSRGPFGFWISHSGSQNNDAAISGQCDNCIGTEGQSESSVGVFGGSDSKYGVLGVSKTSYGVLGRGRMGVRGESEAPNGQGVFGLNDGLSGVGVDGRSKSGHATQGVSETGVGVYGISESGVGVYGESSSGRAALFKGNATVTGELLVTKIDVKELTASRKLFKIDDPLDPANKYLSHVSVESSDMKDLYDGVVTLDGGGAAWVQLPDWFQALNKDFRYQLTCVSAFAPVFIAREIQDNRFQIAGGKPGMKVSWQVTGIRQDAYALAHPLRVEEEKPISERGSYLHPVELGYTEAVRNNLAQPSMARKQTMLRASSRKR